jgi:hypothetical protein
VGITPRDRLAITWRHQPHQGQQAHACLTGTLPLRLVANGSDSEARVGGSRPLESPPPTADGILTGEASVSRFAGRRSGPHE